MPVDAASGVDPAIQIVSFAHLGHADMDVRNSGECSAGVSLTRSPSDLSATLFDALFVHHFDCGGLAENQSYGVGIDGGRADESFESGIEFSTTVGRASEVSVEDSVDVPRATVETLFPSYLASAYLDELDLPSVVETLVIASVQNELSRLTNLTFPTAAYGVVVQRVELRLHGSGRQRLVGLDRARGVPGHERRFHRGATTSSS